MKFTCEKALLQSAISISSRAVSPKSSSAALEGILVTATDELRLTGYNLSTGIRTVVPADVTEEGRLVLDESLCWGCGACEYFCVSDSYQAYSGSARRGINIVKAEV